MGTPSTNTMRRFASTFFVLIALFVASVAAVAAPGVIAATHGSQHGPLHTSQHATPQISQHQTQHTVQHAAPVDDLASLDDPSALPCLEDNSGGLDDTFDLPAVHLVSMPRLIPARPGGIVPMPHAHHASLELRPPIG